MILRLGALSCLLLTLAGPLHAAEPPLIIGVLAHRPSEDVHARWLPLAAYLSRSLGGREVRLRPASYAELTGLLEHQAVDFALTNPSHFIALRQHQPLTGALATMTVGQDGQTVRAYGGVIVVKNDSPVRQLRDLSNKTIAAVSLSSLGGYQAQRMLFHERGIVFAHRVMFVGEPQDKVIDVLLKGEADAGFVRSGVIEAMVREGKLDPAQLRVINLQNLPGFPHAVSTRLYPEWPFFALPQVEEDVARRVAAALLLLQDDPVFGQVLERRGFSVAADYLSVENLLRTLRLPPFDAPPAFTLNDIWQRFQPILLAALVSGGLLVLLVALLLRANYRLATASRALRDNQQKLELAATVFTHAHDGVFIADHQRRIVDVNPAFAEITGYSHDEVVGKPPQLLCQEDGQMGDCDAVWRELQSQGHWRGEVWNRRKDGELYAEMLSLASVLDADGRVSYFVGVFSDISRLKAHEAELDRIAHYDPLTGLPNRRLLGDRLNQALARVRRNGTRLAVCYLDLDGFKPVNDIWGHEAGDRLLVEITRRLKAGLRAADTLARLGGDEFVLLLGDLGEVEECYAVLDRALAVISAPVDIGGHEVSVSASIGVTLCPPDGGDGDTLLRHADQAMYRAKEGGKNRYHSFAIAD